MILGKLKTYLTIAATIIALLSGAYGLFMKVRADHLENERDNALAELTVKTTEVIQYENDLGQMVTKTYEYEKYIGDLEFSNDSIERKLFQTIKASELKERQLKSAMQVQIEASNSGSYDSVVSVALESKQIDFTEEMTKMESIKYSEIRYFNDGFLNAISYPDTLTYTYNEEITILSAARLVKRDFFLWRWVGWKKKIDMDLIEIVSNNPNSKLNGRIIKIRKK